MRFNYLVRSAMLASALSLLMPAGVNASDVVSSWSADELGAEEFSADPRYRDPRYRPRPPHRPPHRPRPPHYPPPHRPRPPHYPPSRPVPPPSYGETLHTWVGQNYYGRSMLPLRQMLGIGPRYNGYRVDSVTVRLRSNYGNGYATLVINGYRASEQRFVNSYLTDAIFFPGPYNDQLGSEIDSLRVELDGDFYVESVTVRLR